MLLTGTSAVKVVGGESAGVSLTPSTFFPASPGDRTGNLFVTKPACLTIEPQLPLTHDYVRYFKSGTLKFIYMDLLEMQGIHWSLTMD